MFENVTARRLQFPALATRVHGHPLAYLDAAATSLQPQVVIDAVVAGAISAAGNPGRGVHALAEAATIVVDEARAEVARLLGSGARADEIVFTSGTTAAVNLVASAWGGAEVGGGDVIIASEAEHHSNLVPWQQLCHARGARLELARVDDRGRLDLDRLAAQLAAAAGRVKLVALAHVSNVLGTLAPVRAVADLAHAAGARLLVDGAQAVAHVAVDVAALGCDFYAFSAHKIYGPPGVGALWARAEILAAMPPWQTGGGMVTRVGRDHARFREPPARFEAGTPNTTGIAGLAAALRFLGALDRAAVAADEATVHVAIVAAVHAAGGHVVGAPELAVVAFTLPGVHPHDLATIADGEGVALRSGHHCAEPIHARFGIDATTRASVACYSSLDDVAAFERALARACAVLR